jgi:hypothetical protein
MIVVEVGVKTECNACFTRSKKLMNFLTLNLLLRVIHKIVVNKLTTINCQHRTSSNFS